MSATDEFAMPNRRFVGTQKLYDNFNAFGDAHIYVIGVGGVGSWVAEALARTGVGQITLIDMDILVESNVNRQLPAITENFGISKIEAMRTRILAINPCCVVHCVDDFLTKDNVLQLLPDSQNRANTVILDCVDDMSAKVAIALHCRFNKLKLIVSGGAGGKTDPTKITVSDLKDTYQDPLLARLRQNLRDLGINKKLTQKFNIKCVYSTQMPKVDTSCQTNGLHCGGYGSAVVVTASVGLIMVAESLKLLK